MRDDNVLGFLNKIREPVSITIHKKILYSLSVLLAGILLGTTSKILDETASNLLPPMLEVLDLRNFFSRIGIWLFFAVLISVYSKTPFRAATNVFLFFVGMVGSYYLYTALVAGFFPESYMMIWITMAFISPLMAFVCWYARGNGTIPVIVSAMIFMFMTRQAFAFGFWYLDIRNGLELILWIGTFFVLYQSPRQMAKVLTIGVLAFFLTAPLNLFWGML